MITSAPSFKDDATFNTWARTGQQLTELGVPFALQLTEFDAADLAAVRLAAMVMSGKASMPDVMAVNAAVEPRRTRKPRMTKGVRVDAATKKVKVPSGKKRGRPKKIAI